MLQLKNNNSKYTVCSQQARAVVSVRCVRVDVVWFVATFIDCLSCHSAQICVHKHISDKIFKMVVLVKPQLKAAEFSSPVSAFCADSYFSSYSTLMLLQYYIKDPGHSAESAGGRLQLNMHTSYVYGFK